MRSQGSRMIKVTEAEALEILYALRTSVGASDFLSWSGDPRQPQPSRYARPDTCRTHPLKPLQPLPIDEWVSKAAPFTPIRSHFLADGPYHYVRYYLGQTLHPRAWRTSEQNKQALELVEGFADALRKMACAINHLADFDRPWDLSDRRTLILRRYIGRLDAEAPLEAFHGKEAVTRHAERWNKFATSLDYLLSDVTADAVNRLLEMTREAHDIIPVHKGPGPARALWRNEFTKYLAHLWYNLYGKLPGQNADGPFVGFVEAVWHSALASVGHFQNEKLVGTPVSISNHRLDELAELNWERQVRQAIVELSKFPQYNQ